MNPELLTGLVVGSIFGGCGLILLIIRIKLG